MSHEMQQWEYILQPQLNNPPNILCIKVKGEQLQASCGPTELIGAFKVNIKYRVRNQKEKK